VTVSELTLSERQGPELMDMWQRRSSPQQGGEIQGRETRDSVGAHLSKEARSGVVGHVATPKPTSVGRCGLKLKYT
jgi:hypothetical protein